MTQYNKEKKKLSPDKLQLVGVYKFTKEHTGDLQRKSDQVSNSQRLPIVN